VIEQKVYKDMISTSPRIDENYLSEILHLQTDEKITDVEITNAIDSNTAFAIKACIHITNGYDWINKKLFIKTAKPYNQSNAYHDKCIREGLFYKFLLDHPGMKIPVPECYDVYISEDDGLFVIVLADLSDFYRTVCPDDQSNEKIWFSCAESLAKFHAAFWNDPQLIKELTVMSEQEIDIEIHRNQEYLDQFLAEFQSKFDMRIMNIFKHALDINHEILLECNLEITKRNHITICNGDSHIYNFMIPYDESYEPLIIDFQFWGDGNGAGDVAHLTRVDFSDELKKSIQIPLLIKYYETLQKYGVKDYLWEDCIINYRKEVAAMVLIPMWQFCCFGLKYEEWMKSVEGLIMNYEFMDCESLM
jgi:hypothetical protein